MKRRSFLQQAGLTVVASGCGLKLANADSPERATGATEDRSTRRILITSAHTPLGRTIADALAATYEVRLTAPRELTTRHPFIPGDLGDAATTDRLVEGMDGIVHVAQLPTEATAQEVMDYRTHGTYNLLRSATDRGVRHVVYLSSLEIMAGYDPDFEVTEDWRPVPSDDTEVLSHYLGEYTCREIAREGRVGVVVLRLGKVVRAGEVSREAWEPLWIDERDAVQAVAKALDARLAGTGELGHPWSVFHISSGSPQARFTCEQAKRSFEYSPQFP